MLTKGRLAPTPSGFLHTGNAINFILNWYEVSKRGGHLALRIDDHDSARCRPRCVEDIFETLDWLKIPIDSGPSGPEEFFKKYSQTLKTQRYKDVALKLENTFACECSRTPLYSGRCRDKLLLLKAGETSLRLKYEGELRDFIVWRKDDLPAYQLVSVVEDADLKINLVVRGLDLMPSTQAQRYLSAQWDEDPLSEVDFIHHELLLDSSGQKLSKSKNSPMDRSGGPVRLYQMAAKLLNKRAHKVKQLSDLLLDL